MSRVECVLVTWELLFRTRRSQVKSIFLKEGKSDKVLVTYLVFAAENFLDSWVEFFFDNGRDI